MTAYFPLIGLLLAASVAGSIAIRRGLLRPPLPTFVPRGPGQGGELAPPLLLGAFAAYSGYLLIAWVASLITGLSSYVPPVGAPSADPPLELVAQTAVLSVLLGMPAVGAIAWWARRLVLQPFDPSPSRIPRLAAEAVLWGLAVLPIVLCWGTAAAKISEALGHPVDAASHAMLKRIIEPRGDATWRMWLIGVAVLGAPVVEEVCYRALLQRGLMTLTRAAWPAIIFTSALFTLMHVGAIPTGSFWAAGSLIFVLSVFLGLLFARTGSVVTPIVVHSMFNAANIAMALYQEWVERTQTPTGLGP